MLLDRIDYKIQIIYVFTLVFHIHVQIQNLSQNQNNSLFYFSFRNSNLSFLSLSLGNGETVYLGNHRMVSTECFRGSSFFLIGHPSYFFVCCHSSLPLVSSVFMFGVACVQTGHCGPHLHSCSVGLLFWGFIRV